MANPQMTSTEDLRHEFDNWCRSSEFTRTCTRPVDAGDQMALRDAHDLLVAALAAAEQAHARELALREALTRRRWNTHLCGACGKRYRVCAGCGTGSPGAETSGEEQCGGHPVTPCLPPCYIAAALAAVSETSAAKPPDPNRWLRMTVDLRLDTYEGVVIRHHHREFPAKTGEPFQALYLALQTVSEAETSGSTETPFLKVSEDAARLIVGACWPVGFEIDDEMRQAIVGIVQRACCAVTVAATLKTCGMRDRSPLPVTTDERTP